MLVNTNSLLEAALHYAGLGYAVFPCAPGGKTPITKHGHKSAATDPDQIENWWKECPDANIGLPTSGLLVIDVDGADNPWPTDAALAQSLIGCPSSRTPGGGRHYIFKQPEGGKHRNTTGKIAPNVDTRADGGYIVVPPSVIDGKTYRWLPTMALELPLEQLSEPPAWLLAALAGSKVSQRSDGNQIPSGQRNDTLARLAGSMRRVGMGYAEVLAGISQTNEDRCCPPLPSKEVERIASSICRYEPDQISVAVAEDHWCQDQHEPGLSVTCVADVKPEPVKWLWPFRFPLGKISLLAGDPGGGKSFLTMEMAKIISTGGEWPDQKGVPVQAGNVLLFASEDAVDDTIRPRLEAAGANLKRIHFVNGVRRENNKAASLFDLSRHVGDLTEYLEKHPDTRLVVLDTLSTYLGSKCDTHRDSEVKQILEPLKTLAEQTKTAVIGVHHLNKSAMTVKAINKLMGSQGFVGSARAVWSVSLDHSDHERRLLCGIKVANARTPKSLAYRIVSPGVVKWEKDLIAITADEALGAPPKESPRTDEAVQFWRELLENGPMKSSICEAAADEAGIVWRTAKRAKNQAGVKSKKNSGKDGTEWVCYLEQGVKP